MDKRLIVKSSLFFEIWEYRYLIEFPNEKNIRKRRVSELLVGRCNDWEAYRALFPVL